MTHTAITTILPSIFTTIISTELHQELYEVDRAGLILILNMVKSGPMRLITPQQPPAGIWQSLSGTMVPAYHTAPEKPD